jgi:fatty acid desaturase
MYKTFRTNPKYLTQYHTKSFLLLGLIDFALVITKGVDAYSFLIFLPTILFLSSTNLYVVMLSFVGAQAVLIYEGLFNWMNFLWLPASAVLALVATAMLHNAAHGNIQPKWLQRSIGEIFAVIQLVGFVEWSVLHVIHHAHPDDPNKDPHPPMGQGYWAFLMGMRKSVLKTMLNEYFLLWGQNASSMKEIKKLALISRGNQIAKIVFWWLLLGPTVFTSLFIPSIILKMMHYAWFNWATHKKAENGFDIINLDNSFYKIVNFFSFGLYYHKYHHLNPKLFDPRTFREKPFEQTKAA